MKKLILLLIFMFLSCQSYAFEPGFPKLVWEREYPFEITEIKMAESGDVLISDKTNAQLILIDTLGYEKLHLGPKLDGLLVGINISSDGNKIMYLNGDNNPPLETEFDTLRLHYITKKGEEIWEGNFKSDKFGFTGTSEIVKGGYVIWNYKEYHKIYDYLGNVVTEIPQDVKKAFISTDGKAVLFQHESTFRVLNLPDKSLKMEGNLAFIEAKLSFNGKYVISLKEPTNDIPENIIIICTQDKSMWKTKHDNIYSIDLTNDGKYLLIVDKDHKHLSYYQLY